MKRFLRRKNRIKTLAMCAALTCSFAADSVVYPYYACAVDDEDEDEETEAAVSSDILKDVFGSIEFWRWERVGKDNYPRDDKEHLSLFFFGNWTPYGNYSRSTYAAFAPANANVADGKLFSATAPDDIWLGPSADPVPGVPAGNLMGNVPQYFSHFVADDGETWGDYIREQYAHYIKLDTKYTNPDKYKAYGVDLSKDLFYTTADMNCINVKYNSANSRVKGADGRDCPYYTIRLKSSSKQYNYYYRATDKSSESLPLITTDGSEASTWTFQSFEDSRNRGVTWLMKIDDKDADDEVIGCRNTDYVFTMDEYEEGYSADSCKWYIGTKLRYSALKGTTTVRDGQILSISAGGYITGDGEAEAQNGVFLKNGDKVVIEKGGILSVEGDFINDGTIINNGGTIIVKKNGSIYPFQQGTGPAANGCGTIKCLGGDIIIQEGGAIYAGLSDENGAPCPFLLDEGSVLINQGLLVYGSMRLGNGARVELYENSKTYGSYGTQTKANGNSYAVAPDDSKWMVGGDAVTATSGNGTMPMSDYLYLKRNDDDDYKTLYDECLGANSEQEAEVAEKLMALEEKKSNSIEAFYTTTYITSDGHVISSKGDVVAQAEAQGYSLVSEDADGTLHFAAYSYDGKFNDLLRTNNGSFLSGNISAVKFLTSCSGLSGMYKWGEAVKAPVVLKVDSAYISDVNMVTDKSKPNYIEVGKLTI